MGLEIRLPELSHSDRAVRVGREQAPVRLAERRHVEIDAGADRGRSRRQRRDTRGSVMNDWFVMEKFMMSVLRFTSVCACELRSKITDASAKQNKPATRACRLRRRARRFRVAAAVRLANFASRVGVMSNLLNLPLAAYYAMRTGTLETVLIVAPHGLGSSRFFCRARRQQIAVLTNSTVAVHNDRISRIAEGSSGQFTAEPRPAWRA
jgi:hypothetical protein